MLSQRLTLGPPLLIALALIAWLDEAITGAAVPAFISRIFPDWTILPPGTAIFFVLLTVVLLAAIELAGLLRANGIESSKRIICVAAIAGFIAPLASPVHARAEIGAPLVITVCVLALVLSMIFHARKQNLKGVIAAAGGTLLAFVYLGLLMSLLMAIRREHSAWTLLAVILVTKSCDIGAYFTGITLGRHKLIPWLSPGKTWEGLAGGVATSTVVGLLAASLSHYVGLEMSLGLGALAGFIFGLVGQAGDLMASMLKRDAGVKDASDRLPGFGGILDVVDSPLLVAPAAFWLLRLTTPS